MCWPRPGRYVTLCSMGRSRKEITFDLSQEALRQHYPHKETAQDPQFFKRAYKDIQRFMDANGFERRQHSVYVSAEKLSALDAAVLTQRMAEQLPWLRLCVKDITVTSIGARIVGRNSALRRPRLRRGLRPLPSFLLSPPQPRRWVAAGTPERRSAALRRRPRRTPAARSQGAAQKEKRAGAVAGRRVHLDTFSSLFYKLEVTDLSNIILSTKPSPAGRRR